MIACDDKDSVTAQHWAHSAASFVIAPGGVRERVELMHVTLL